MPLKSEIQNVLIRIKGSWPANLPVRTSTGVINFFLIGLTNINNNYIMILNEENKCSNNNEQY